MNHPHFNTNNRLYQYAMNIYLQSCPQCLSANGNTSTTMRIPMNVVKVKMRDPVDTDNIIDIDAAADAQSDIEAIGINAIIRFKELGLIKTDRNGITIGTGNGPVHVKQYVPLTVISKIGKEYTRKFWCLESLPSHDFLLGNQLCDRLGGEFRNKYETWEHVPSNLDHVDNELDDLPCSNYPWNGEPDIDISQINIKNEQLRPFLRRQLQDYQDVIAKHEWDSGRILQIPPFLLIL